MATTRRETPRVGRSHDHTNETGIANEKKKGEDEGITVIAETLRARTPTICDFGTD
jgi:hypothetical protein